MNIKYKGIKIILSLALMTFVLTMTPASTFLQIIKPAEAAALTNVAVVPSNNIVNTRSIYEIFFKTVTTGTIKTIEMSFPSGFDVSIATKLIEKSGIGSGSLSAPNPTTLIYTVNNPVSVPAGTSIRFEIGRIINSNMAGSFQVSIATENPTPIIIDGPTLSGSFPIKDITGNDVSPSLMIQKTLHDDTVGNTRGWNPDGFKKAFAIADPDISSAPNSQFVSMMVRSENAVFCSAAGADTGLFVVYCNSAPNNSADINYIITKLPSHDVTSSVAASALPDVDSINRQDETSSEFP